jgi:NB-ARC domain/Rx N-terminal domain
MTMILDAFLSKFSELLTQMVQDEVGMLLGIPGQIEKLNKTIGYIIPILYDAEKKKTNNRAIEHWLMELKDVMYDADDVIDLYEIKAKEHLADCTSCLSPIACGCGRFLSCIRDPFFAHQIGSKIKDINDRLEEIAKRKTDLGLIEFHAPSDQVRRVDSIIYRKTDPLIVQDDIVGEKIEEDTKMLVNLLTEELKVKGAREKVVVVAIVGMGGIGKTTLAKRIFNDQRIQAEFKLKIWVCVSKEVRGVELLKGIIREVGGDHGAAHERSELVPLLQRLVQGKKFLLVLDDIWEESRAIWDDLLRAPLMSGADGSRLLITTRDERVANGMRATKTHRVERLCDEDGWSLLIKQVYITINIITRSTT